MCIQERLLDALPRVIVGAVASTLADTTLPPAYRKPRISLPTPKVLGDSDFIVEPLSHEPATAASASLPSVCAIHGATYVLPVVNVSDKQINLRAGTPIAAISFVMPQATASCNSAAI